MNRLAGRAAIGGPLTGIAVMVLLVVLAGFKAADSGAMRHRDLSPARDGSAGGRVPLGFELNRGQVDPQVRFLARGSGYSLYLTPAEAVFVMGRCKGKSAKTGSLHGTLRLRLVGGDRKVLLKGLNRLPGTSNYFIGRTSSAWKTRIPRFEKVRMEGVYPGIDMVYYGSQQRLEYDFVVSPGADPAAISLEAQGASSMNVDPTGGLVFGMGKGEIAFDAPVAYQVIDGKRRPVVSRYVLGKGRRIGFEVGAYDPTHPLVIDPVLDYSTYLGGSGYDQGNAIAVDASGHAYVAGFADVGFPTTGGSVQPVNGGGAWEAFVAKFDPSGGGLVYSTYLGGNAENGAYGIKVDPSGNAYVVGYSKGDFPTTNGAYQTVFGGGASGNSDAFVAKLDASGSALLYSTYLGGAGTEDGRSLALDASGNVYVTGTTTGPFPTTAGSFQTTLGGDKDAWVAKLNPSGSALVYSTYLGGSGTEGSGAIAVDGSGNAYVVGQTGGLFPTTTGAYQTNITTGQNLFVAKLNATGSALAYSTYLGGTAGLQGAGIAVDGAGNAYVAGSVGGSGFPTTPGAYQTVFGGGAGDVFVTKLNAAGSDLIYSTYLGGTWPDFGNALAIDSSGNAYVTGSTWGGFPTTAGALQTVAGSNGDAFVTELNATGTALIYSTYLGLTAYGYGSGIALDAAGNVYITGLVTGEGFSATAGAYQSSFGGHNDAFVMKFDKAVFNASGVTPTPTPNRTTASFPLKELPPKGGSYVAPQPARGTNATVAYWMEQNGNVEIRVFNAVGQWLSSKRETKSAGPQTSALELSGFAPGVYLYQVRFSYDSGGNGTLPVAKFMVTR